MTENNKNNEINFKCNNPGVVRYGNFINYYKFHPAENRIKMLPSNIWDKNNKQYVCLDIGCNAGDLTIAIYDHLRINTISDIKILGIDLDSTLVTRANEKNNDQNISFECIDIMNNTQKTEINNYLSKYNLKIFDIIFCFSTSMWIHLNYGDSGLKKFLNFICEKTKMIVIEPQPWKCYRTAVKRLKLSNNEFPCFKELKIRTNVESFIEESILGNGFNKVHESPSSEWGRKILFFTKSEKS